MLARRLHVAQGEIGTGFQQLRGVVARQVAARLAGEHTGAVGVAGLQRDEAVAQGGDAEVAAAVVVELGEVTRRVENAAQDGPGEDHRQQRSGDEECRHAQPRLHTVASDLDHRGAGQADQPGDQRRDGE